MSKMNLPNKLTIFRVILIVPLLSCYWEVRPDGLARTPS